MLKRSLFCFLLLWIGVAHASNSDDLLVLLPPQLGDIGLIDTQTVETIYGGCTSYADGVIHSAAYKDGVVTTIISGSTKEAKKAVGMQYIYSHGKEISNSAEYFLDRDKQNTIIHIHKKYIVTTTPEKQTITAR